MREIQKMIVDFVEDRPVMKENNSDLNKAYKLILDEVAEAGEVLHDKEKLGRELADIAWMVISMANLQGIDLDTEIRTKCVRNFLKRPACDWQTGTYEECDENARSKWTQEMEDEYYADIK